jgi:hypothetical protein
VTNDVAAAAVAFVGDNADGAAAESRLVAAPDDWDESRAEIAGRRDATIAGTKDAVSSRELLFFDVQTRNKFYERKKNYDWIIINSFFFCLLLSNVIVNKAA